MSEDVLQEIRALTAAMEELLAAQATATDSSLPGDCPARLQFLSEPFATPEGGIGLDCYAL